MVDVDPANHLGLAFHLAHKFCQTRNIRCPQTCDDAVQEACLALVVASRRFNPNHPKANWIGCAVRCIRGALRLWLHRGRLIQPPDRIRVEEELTFLPITPDLAGQLTKKTSQPNGSVFLQELLNALSKLPREQEQLLKRRYGISREKQTLEQIGTEAGVTKEAVRVRERNAMNRLKKIAHSAISKLP